ncbi:MAG: DUF1772 domain-containing protein [Candidatus Dormibacteraeota bacterium]|nr:DUF1772 domain-containing protein [Candidatus Dormibacteraeota bacterium]
MTAGDVAGMVSVLFAGLLAGEEFVMRCGIRGPLASLDDRSHILVRQALIRSLRVLVPSIYALALLSAVAGTALDGVDAGLALRGAGILALVIWIAVTLAGTVPINAAALEWDVSDPPVTWRTQVDRWERLNTVRTWAAVVAFALLLVGFNVTAIG